VALLEGLRLVAAPLLDAALFELSGGRRARQRRAHFAASQKYIDMPIKVA
jgi:hypothetical protein